MSPSVNRKYSEEDVNRINAAYKKFREEHDTKVSLKKKQKSITIGERVLKELTLDQLNKLTSAGKAEQLTLSMSFKYRNPKTPNEEYFPVAKDRTNYEWEYDILKNYSSSAKLESLLNENGNSALVPAEANAYTIGDECDTKSPVLFSRQVVGLSNDTIIPVTFYKIEGLNKKVSENKD